MRILILCDKAFSLSETFIHKQVRCLKNHNVDLVCRKRLNADNFKLPSTIKFITLYKNLLFRVSYKLWKDEYSHPPIVSRFLKSLLSKNNYDLVMCFYGTQGVKMLPLMENNTIPFYISFHGFDATRKLNDSNYVSRIKRVIKRVDCVKNPCSFLANRLVELGLPQNKSSVIYNGTDLDFIDSIKSEKDSKDEKIRLLHVGRLVPNKGILDLLKVFTKLKKKGLGNLKLEIVGYGKQEEELKYYVRSQNLLHDVIFHGAMSNKSVVNKMKESDIFILNAQTDSENETEGFPNVILEAMASGIPIISTVHAGIPEAIVSGKHGILVPEKDNDALLNAITVLINDSKMGNALRLNARKRVETEFSEDILCQNMNQLVQSLVKT